MRPLATLLLSAALALPAGAALSQGAPRQCFALRNMDNTRVADAQTLYARVRGRDVWRFDMAGACLSRQSSDGLLVSPTGGRATICGPLDVDIRSRYGGMETPCIVRGVTKLTPREAAALPKKLRP